MHIAFLDILHVTFERNCNANQHFVLSGSCINKIHDILTMHCISFTLWWRKNTAWGARLQKLFGKKKYILF